MNQPNPSATLGLPDWLAPAPRPKPARSLSHVSEGARRHDSPSQVIRTQYPFAFETMLDKVRSGDLDLREVVEQDARNINIGDFLSWVMTSPERKQRYYDAQEIGAEIISMNMMSIADAADSLEDVARSALRISTRKWLMAIWNRKRFGEVKQIEANVVQETKVTFALTRPFAAEPVAAIEGEFTESLPHDAPD